MFATSDGHMLASMSGPDPPVDTVNWSDLGVSELPTGTVTLLLADVEGSTRLWETEPDQMSDAVARLDRALTDLVASYQGVRPVEQGEGDSFVVAFARATDAVACALKLQQAPLAPIRLRIGLHTGEVRLRDVGKLHRSHHQSDRAPARSCARRPDRSLGRLGGIGFRSAPGRCVAHRSRHTLIARCSASGTSLAAVPSRSAQRVPTAATA